ncbi:MAG: glycosyltransferase family 4 protein [Clostridiales bacterium]|nr:glycosyltransferase family 4 protein [Clostridiales bacterium]
MLKKVTVLTSHIPDPRIQKRIEALEKEFNISLICWDRMQQTEQPFEASCCNNITKFNIRAPQGKPVQRIIPLMKYMLCAIKALIYEKPDIIHAGNLDMLFIASVYKYIFDKKVKIVYEVADLHKYAFVKRISSLRTLFAILLQKLEKRLTSGVSKLILTSPYFWEEYFSKFVTADKYLFIPNVPSKKIFGSYVRRVHNSFTIGFIGLIRYVDQLKMLIDAVGELDEDVKVFIAGSGPGYKDILDYVKGKDYVEMYGPYNYEKEIVNLYEKVDCVYAVYDTNLKNVRIALPNRLYEAIVCEIPIIAAKGTKLGQFIEENQIGVTVNDRSKEELKDVIINLINEKDMLLSYQQNCNKIKPNYYYEENSKKLLKVYKNLY